MLVRNIYIRVGTNILTIGIGLVAFVLIIRTYGVEVVGNIAYYYSLAGIFSLFADLGISTAYNKFLASKENTRDITVYLFLKSFLIAVYILVFFLAYIFKLKNDGIDDKLLFIVFAGVVFDLIGQIFTSTFTGRRDFSTLSKLEIVSALTVCVYNITACFVIVNKYFLAGNLAVPHLVIITGGLFYFGRHRLFKPHKPKWPDIKKYKDYCLPGALSDSLTLLFGCG